ncbi:MAG: zinc ribbon domain-containing protein [Acidobacteriota bacterium]
MYCPSCGKDILVGLKFCNFCGVRLVAAENDPTQLAPSSFNFLVAAVIAIPVLGLGLIIALMATMKNGLGFRDDMIFVVVFMTFLLLIIAEIGTLILMLTRTRKPKTKIAKEPTDFEQRAARAIEDRVIRDLNPASFEGVASVTEHTTRTLDPAYRKSSDE